MGVKGLWKLIECSGVPVPLETLEHKVLGVDVSIWLHQAVRGFRGPGGAAVANAHLLTLFHRICKLLFYRIRPVFVFDGGVPHLKKQTLTSRKLRREVAASKAKEVRERLLSNLLKSQAVRKALGKTGPGPSAVHVARPKKVEKDMFELPPLPEEGKDLIKSEQEDESQSILKNYELPNLHQFDFESEDFKSLPLESQHEILSELVITRKENSWNSLNNMPQESNDFAQFQMGRLMKRRKFQSTLDDIRTEMQKKKSAEMEMEMFGELEKHVSLTQRIVSEDAAHSIFIKKIKENKEENVLIERDAKQEDYKGKSPMKRKREDFEKDFLTELEKQGIAKRCRFDSDSDSDLDDYYDLDESGSNKVFSQSEEKLDFDGQALLRVVTSLVDNDGLSQEEILALIKQGGPGEIQSASSSSADGPCTSGKAPGFVFNPDADSSDDDGDFIEVSEPSSPVSLLEDKNKESKEDAYVDNVKKVLETKNSSLWIKIMQQKLDDVVHMTSNKKSPVKARVDSRNLGSAREEESNISNGEKPKVVSIDLNFDVSVPLKEDDIFADIFSGGRTKEGPNLVAFSGGHAMDEPSLVAFSGGHAMDEPNLAAKPERKKPHSNLEAMARKLSRYSDMQEKQKVPLAIPKIISVKDILLVNEKKKENKRDLKIEKKLQLPINLDDLAMYSGLEKLKKIKEMQEMKKKTAREKIAEDELMISSDDSDIEDYEKYDPFPSRINQKKLVVPSQVSAAPVFDVEDEVEVDEVEIMSSSEDSDADVDVNDKDSTQKSDDIRSKSEQKKNNGDLGKLPDICVNDSEKDKEVEDNGVADESISHQEENNQTSNAAIELESKSPTHIKDLVLGKSSEVMNADDLGVETSTTENNDPYSSEKRKLNEKEETRVAERERVMRDQDLEDMENGDAIEDEMRDQDLEDMENGDAIEDEMRDQDLEDMENGDAIEGEKRPSSSDEPPEKDASVDEIDEQDLEGPGPPFDYTQDELKHLEGQLADEQKALIAQAQKVERVSSNLNDQMYGESQHLLQLFGIPYLVAPMEAEAQCAYLDAINLTGGTITDDSDIFLFGGTKVYKHFFNQARHVEFFKTDNITANLGLDREKMITLALLTGSDYTDGIESVGAVSGMELLTEFPGEGIDCLRAFKKWWNAAHRNVSAAYFSKVKQKMSLVHLPEAFPSENVFKAYLKPDVDESREKFSWAVPNVDALRQFTAEKFGWNRAKVDDILLPVMKKLGVKSTQMRIDSFFTSVKLVKDDLVHSKRMRDAIAKAKGEEPPSAKGSSPFKRPSDLGKRPPARKRKIEDREEPIDKINDSKEQQVKKPSRTLLMDPSESRSGPEVSKEPPNAKTKAPRKKKNDDKDKKSSGPGITVREIEEEFVPPRKLTKEIMFEALNKKQTISQRDSDKLEMEDKKKLAAELLRKNIGKKKR